MKTKAVRLYGKNDIRFDSFDLPELKDDEILARVISNSICPSSYKALVQGTDHNRIPNDVAENPIILGHEFSGTLVQVGRKYRNKYRAGEKFSVQPALFIPGRELDAVGYTYRFIGGNASYIIIPPDVTENDCLLPYDGDAFYKASLAEPVSCVISAFNDQFHTGLQGEKHVHKMGIKPRGACALLAAAGPMGQGAIDYALHGPVQPRLLVITDIDQQRLDRAAAIFTPQHAQRLGIELKYINTRDQKDTKALMALTENSGYDDIFVFAPVVDLLEQADSMLAYDGCLNFFAGPIVHDFIAKINYHAVHYKNHRIIGTTGSNTADMRAALTLMEQGRINPATMITHVGGLDAAAGTILNHPQIPGGKKLIYTQVSMPLTALAELEQRSGTEPMLAPLAEIISANEGIWCVEAENYLLANAPPIG